MEPNIPMIKAVLSHIESHLDSFNMNDWGTMRFNKKREVCGTQMCFAGWTVYLNTAEADRSKLFSFEYAARVALMSYTVRDDARELLGLTLKQSGILFHAMIDRLTNTPQEQFEQLKYRIEMTLGIKLEEAPKSLHTVEEVAPELVSTF